MVAADEKEGGVRATLNLGHTFGHAIETATGYGTFLHGEAVSIGMVMAADMSVRLVSLCHACWSSPMGFWCCCGICLQNSHICLNTGMTPTSIGVYGCRHHYPLVSAGSVLALLNNSLFSRHCIWLQREHHPLWQHGLFQTWHADNVT